MSSSMLTSDSPRSLNFIAPRVGHVPENVGTHEPRVNAFLLFLDMGLFGWQRLVNQGVFAVKADGSWAGSEVGLLVSRQNGKSEDLIAYLLAHLFLFPKRGTKGKTILYTAHELKTTQEIFMRIKGVIEANAELAPMLDRVYEGNGNWTIVLKKRKGQHTADRIKFIARSKSSGRGFSADVIVFDEAQELSQLSYDALTYTQTTIKNSQLFFTGTVPEDGENESEIWEGVRDRGRAGKDGTVWYEWTPDGSDDPDTAESIAVEDGEVWESANPSMHDGLFGLDVVREQYERDRSPGKASFRRERLSIWPARREVDEQTAASGIDLAVWESGSIQSRLGSGAVLSVVIGRGGGYSTIAGAQRGEDEDRIFVEHLDTRVGTMWLADALAEYRDKHKASLIVLDEKNCAPIVSDLQRRGIRFMAMNMNEVAAAFDQFLEYVNAGMVLHPVQEELTIALANAVPRVMSKANNLRTWEQGDPSEPVSPAQAVTLALWGVKKWEARPASAAPASAQVLSAPAGSGGVAGDDFYSMHF